MASEFIHHQALVYELCARFFVGRGDHRLASAYLTEACYGYKRWGATIKAAELAAEHPLAGVRLNLIASSERAAGIAAAGGHEAEVSASNLDLRSIFQAAEVIVGEVVLDNVLRMWMGIVMQNVGAQRGSLVLLRDKQLIVTATMTVYPESVQVGLSTPIEESGSTLGVTGECAGCWGVLGCAWNVTRPDLVVARTWQSN
jgi:hypothetical protein